MRDRGDGIWRWFHAPRFEAQFEYGAERIQTDSLGYVIEKQNPKMPSQRNCRLRSQLLDYPRKATDATCKQAYHRFSIYNRESPGNSLLFRLNSSENLRYSSSDKCYRKMFSKP